MVEKLKRLSPRSQEAVRQLACLGHSAEITTLTLVHEKTEEAIHDTLREAVYTGLIDLQDGAYRFAHDRIQQVAYSLIPEERRAEIHVRSGRALVASMSTDQLAEHLFEVAGQFNRGAGRLIELREKMHVAAIELRAGRRAKASAAYESERASGLERLLTVDEGALEETEARSGQKVGCAEITRGGRLTSYAASALSSRTNATHSPHSFGGKYRLP
jgi:predicted ATPase